MKITVDAVVFTYIDNKLKVLLIKRAYEPFIDQWSLPGGFILDNETAEDAVVRKLNEETNVSLDYLEQLYTFSKPERDPRGRIISIAHYALISSSKHQLVTNIHAKEVRWIDVDDINDGKIKLAFDHNEIFNVALTRLQNKIRYEPIGFELLPKYFSLPELHQLYCAISGIDFDRRNFSKKINSFSLLNKTQHKTKGGVGRRAQLYEFNKEKYDELINKGFNFDI